MKRSANSGQPGTSSSRPGLGTNPDEANFLAPHQSSRSLGQPAAKKINLDIKEEINECIIEQSGALVPDQLLASNLKREAVDEEDEDETSRSPVAAIDEEEEDDDDADSVIEKANIPQPSDSFMEYCAKANLVEDHIVIGSWEMYYHASQRVSLEGSEKAWQLSAIYYYFLSRGVKRTGKSSRLLTHRLPFSFYKVMVAFDVSVMELFDKTARFIEIINSRKIRRFAEHLRRTQEALASTCFVFKKFVKVYTHIFVDCKKTSKSCPTTYELFNTVWTCFLILKSRLPSDDLLNNYMLMFSLIDDFYTKMCAQKDGVVHHLNQEFVASLLNSDSTILRALCSKFGCSVMDTRHFCDHVYKNLDKGGLPTIWNFVSFRETIISYPQLVYDRYLTERGCIDERILVPKLEKFEDIFKPTYRDETAKVMRCSPSGVEFQDADFLTEISSKQCIEKLSNPQSKTGNEKVREQPRVPYVEYNLCLGTYPEDQDSHETHLRLKKIIGGWTLDMSDLKKICEQMADNPMATLLLKCDVLCEKFEDKLGSEMTGNSKIHNRYHKQIRLELEKLFLIFIEKIIVAEMKKKVREEELLIVIRREEFLDSVFCFCVELALFSNTYIRAFPWSAELCDCHPFLFHKVIDLMINHERRLSRAMVQHFNKIEESVIDVYAWKSDSPLWPMAVRCPFTNFHEFGDDWGDKIRSFTPTKFNSNKKPDVRDELGRPMVPQNRTSRTLRVFLKRTFFTAARRLHELTDRVSMPMRAKSQCWSLFDYLIRNESVILMDRHLDQILLCCAYVVMKMNSIPVTFNEIIAHYRRQHKDATTIYRKVTVFADQVTDPKPVNTKETILQRLEAPPREKTSVSLIDYYNLEFRDRIKFIIGQIDNAADEDLMEMPVPTAYGLMPVKVYLTNKVSIQMMPRTVKGTSKQEVAIAHLEKNGVDLEFKSGTITVPAI